MGVESEFLKAVVEATETHPAVIVLLGRQSTFLARLWPIVPDTIERVAKLLPVQHGGQTQTTVCRAKIS